MWKQPCYSMPCSLLQTCKCYASGVAFGTEGTIFVLAAIRTKARGSLVLKGPRLTDSNAVNSPGPFDLFWWGLFLTKLINCITVYEVNVPLAISIQLAQMYAGLPGKLCSGIYHNFICQHQSRHLALNYPRLTVARVLTVTRAKVVPLHGYVLLAKTVGHVGKWLL